MSKQPEELIGYAAAIVSDFAKCETKARKLYPAYLQERFKEGLGLPGWGEGPDAFEAWMAGESEPGATNLVFVCRAIRARLAELGKESILPDLPFPKTVVAPSGGDGQPASTSGQVSSRCFTQWAPDLLEPAA
jgi:hypothetical protein